MHWDLLFFLNSILLGVGLAMDAFSVSVTYGLSYPAMPFPDRFRIAFCFAGFQFAMPMIGWLCVRTIAEMFTIFYTAIPWIALVILSLIGGKMLYEGISRLRGNAGDDSEPEMAADLSTGKLLALGVATSIDALSVGFTIAEYHLPGALVCSLLIGLVTYCICTAGIKLGKKFGALLYGKGDILGGVILIAIGLEIFLTHQ